MIGCCFCTKAGCYQDKEAIEYYVGGGARVSQDFDAMRPVNGSDAGFSDKNGQAMRGVASEERQAQEELAGGKLIR